MKHLNFHFSLLRIILGFMLLGLAGAFAEVAIDPPSRTFDKNGTARSILTSGTGSWEATTTAPWITFPAGTSGIAGDSCIYIVEANFSADTRRGEIRINNNVHTVTQTGYTATISPDSASVTLDGGSGTINVIVAPAISWNAASNSNWATVSPLSGVGSGTVQYTVAAYSGVTPRAASLTVAGKTFTLTQSGADVNITPKQVQKPYNSGIVQVQVSALANTTWDVVPHAPWISVIDPGNGFGDSTITLALGTNPSFLERSSIVDIGSATISIRQFGTPNPVLDIVPREATADPAGAQGNVAILATPDAGWTATSLNPWLIIAGGTSGNGNGNIGYVVSANPGLAPRVGIIEVAPPIYIPRVNLLRGLRHWFVGRTDIANYVNPWGGGQFNFDGRTRIAGNLTPSTNAFTMSFWFRVDVLGQTQRLFATRPGGGELVSTIYVEQDNRLWISVGGVKHDTGVTIEDKCWQQITLTQDENGMAELHFSLMPLEHIARHLTFEEARADAAIRGGRLAVIPLPENNQLLKEQRIFWDHSRVEHWIGLSREEGKTNWRWEDGRDATWTSFRHVPPELHTAAYMHANWPVADGYDWDSTDDINRSYPYLLERTAKPLLVSKQLGVVPRIWPYGTHTQIILGESEIPFQGYFEGLIRDFRIFSRVINPDERKALTDGFIKLDDTDQNNINPVIRDYIEPFSLEKRDGITPDGRYELNSNGMSHRSPRAWHSKLSLAKDRFGRPQCASKSDGGWYNFSRPGGGGGNATYAFWFKLDANWDLHQRDHFFNKRLNGRDFNMWFLKNHNNKGPHIEISGDVGAAQTHFPIDLPPRTFHHFVFTVRAGRIWFVLNGKEIGSSPIGNYNWGNPENRIHVGFKTPKDSILDDIAWYHRGLTVSEIKAIYEAEKPNNEYHRVTQGVFEASISPSSGAVGAAGGTASTELSVPLSVTWVASSNDQWIDILSPTNLAGPITFEVEAEANLTVYPREGSVTVAGQTFTISQEGLNAIVIHDDLVFATDGGSGWIDVSAEGNGSWLAVSNDPWITIAQGSEGVGSGAVFIVADPFTQATASRVGSVTVAGHVVYVTQRGYELSITPQVAQVGSNAGAGEFAVAAPIGAVWEAIVTEPWITLLGGFNGVSDGVVRYSVTENRTGKSRQGRIIIAGEEYSITQTTTLTLVAESDGNGTVAGSGEYETNDAAILTATPQAGYVFSHWTGDSVGSANPLTVLMDSGKTVTATFIPEAAADAITALRGELLDLVPQSECDAAVQEILDNPNKYSLYTSDQIKDLALGYPVLEKDVLSGKMRLKLGVKRKGAENLRDWLDVILSPDDVEVREGKVEIQISPEGKAAFYRLEGSP